MLVIHCDKVMKDNNTSQIKNQPPRISKTFPSKKNNPGTYARGY